MQNGVGEHENEAHQKLGHQMGQQMMQENPAAGLSQPPGHCHILLAPELEHLAPNEPGQAGPVGGGHADEQPLQSPSAGKGDENHQDRVGHAHHQVNEPVDEAVHGPGACGRRNADEDRRHGADGRGADPHSEAGRQAFQSSQKQVPPQVVRAEGMGPGGGLLGLGKIRSYGAVRNQAAGQEGHQQDQENEPSEEKQLSSAVAMQAHEFTSLIWGSTTPYSRLAIRLPVQTNRVEKRAMPKSRGTSEFSPAAATAEPRPG